MKAALCKSLDGPQSLIVERQPEPVPKPGQAIVNVKAIGLNFADTLITRGKYQFKPDLPFSPGAEIAGVVEYVSDPSSAISPGQRVMAYVNWGGAAERIAVDAQALIPIPDDVPMAVAAGLSVTYGTAMHGLRDRGRLCEGETVVVTGAAGGAGQAAVEIAKLMNARVVAVASSPEKCEIAIRAGADKAILFPGSDLKTEVRALTGGDGADVIYDCIGGNAAEPLIRALAWQGRFLVVGFAAGEIPKIPINLLLLRGSEMAGVFWGESVRRDPARHRANMLQLLDWVAAGRLSPRIHATYPLERIVEALGVLERREATGKVVLTIE
ncbi:alcohol dehydrogenase zinc-binding domain-containing protein [Hyphomicrobium denitrificans 1NES1]|uniref:Alcohol dehydrogenase zinc-binding domain-containing protein n=1 Tax=Hyphomicrobium denitrificans 1NES1 TaxID=670307 RepID=N0B994_9HYPH|nr:NADPH:quinone oxidoreductase family protein [Hyphomicrobium denitrificans]AGK59598.1 alcohol dehydrogenase zinc-binding domain-containing protein [Hyphomicrobium denitrificans 1NES1]